MHGLIVQLRLVSFVLLALAALPAHASVLPDVLINAHVTPKTSHWTIPDIVEVRRIKGTAIQGASRIAAFILEQPSIADGKNHYGLYEFDAARGDPPRKIAEAGYMADLAWRPQTKDWTVRADFGAGVQLYTIKRSGLRQPLLLIPDTTLVGGSVGMLYDGTEGPRLTGVASYGWSPDGRRFWYSRLRHKVKASVSALLDGGVVFDEHRMVGVDVTSVERATKIADYELRVFDTANGSDRLVATSSPPNASSVFRGHGLVAWVDASHLQYCQFNRETGTSVWSLWRFDLGNGNVIKLRTAAPEAVVFSTPTEAGYLTVQHQGSTSNLIQVSVDGRRIENYGDVKARYLDGGAIWRSPAGDRFIYGAYLSDRNGLDAAPKGPLSKALEAITDYLSACSFNSDLSFGVCSDESLSKAPELVSISGATGEVGVIARPNARYDAIAPLKTVKNEWTNRYGAKNDGYITYPRDYVSGHSYPALVVTHGGGAQNDFAQGGFQWEFPIQLMAEQGYFILSVNEPKIDPNEPPPYAPGGAQVGVARQQFNEFLNPTASMEAAVEPLIANGAVNPKAVGIAGYSHGAETTYFVISHSKVFSAASLGDDPGMIPSWFWIGVSSTKTWMKGLYGGSPFDAGALDNYRKYSTSFRRNEVKAPLLQQFAGSADAVEGLEVDQLFKDSGIPTELVVYPTESHVFYAPRHRASAMERNLDWFNYWLLSRSDPDPAKADQYARWDAMAARWHEVQQVVGAGPSPGKSVGAHEVSKPILTR